MEIVAAAIAETLLELKQEGMKMGVAFRCTDDSLRFHLLLPEASNHSHQT